MSDWTSGAGGGDDEAVEEGLDPRQTALLDDMLWGAVMGFFWPIGCAMWLRREKGVWSWRKGLTVFVGVVVNVAFGAVRGYELMFFPKRRRYEILDCT